MSVKIEFVFLCSYFDHFSLIVAMANMWSLSIFVPE